MTKAPDRRVVRPKDSASVMVVRQGADGPTILMGRRGASAVFGGFWVFPGGKVDAADRCARPAHELHPAAAAKVATDLGRARAFAMAAVRETFEETGLIIGAPGAVGGGDHVTYRALAAAGQAPRLDRLHYIGQAVTPRFAPHRFNARFFAIDAADATGKLAGSGELTDLAWRPLAACLDLPLIDVTRFMLGALLRQMAAGFPVDTARPRFAYRQRRRIITYR